MPVGKLKFPNRYDQGYNELDVIGQNLLPIKKVPFYLDIKAFVPVVKEQIEKGKIILEKDITCDWKQIIKDNQQILYYSEEIIGKENMFYKKKGDTFYKYDIKETDIIKKQDECTINAKSGSVRITMPGVSLKNGSLGSTIKVLNKQTGKILNARIVDSKNVEVEIN
ncbi:MAG: flagellar basal body P-ring formation chaperone FlgA [Candidatus Riflemargulisbacteria bacterium]